MKIVPQARAKMGTKDPDQGNYVMEAGRSNSECTWKRVKGHLWVSRGKPGKVRKGCSKRSEEKARRFPVGSVVRTQHGQC